MNALKLRRGLVWLILLAFALGSTGCTWMGRTAGRAQAKAERNIEAIEQGYNKGYEEERSKSDASQ